MLDNIFERKGYACYNNNKIKEKGKSKKNPFPGNETSSEKI